MVQQYVPCKWPLLFVPSMGSTDYTSYIFIHRVYDGCRLIYPIHGIDGFSTLGMASAVNKYPHVIIAGYYCTLTHTWPLWFTLTIAMPFYVVTFVPT